MLASVIPKVETLKSKQQHSNDSSSQTFDNKQGSKLLRTFISNIKVTIGLRNEK